jgi:hypothetical protein
MYRAHSSIKFDSDKWHRKLLGPILVKGHTLWTLRNGKQHGTEQRQKRTRRLQQLERDLHNLFHYKDTDPTPVAQLMTELFALVQSSHMPRPVSYQTPHHTFEQQPLLFGDLPT